MLMLSHVRCGFTYPFDGSFSVFFKFSRATSGLHKLFKHYFVWDYWVNNTKHVMAGAEEPSGHLCVISEKNKALWGRLKSTKNCNASDPSSEVVTALRKLTYNKAAELREITQILCMVLHINTSEIFCSLSEIVINKKLYQKWKSCNHLGELFNQNKPVPSLYFDKSLRWTFLSPSGTAWVFQSFQKTWICQYCRWGLS